MGYRIRYDVPKHGKGTVLWMLWTVVVFREVLNPSLWKGLSMVDGIYECMARLCGRLIYG